MDPIRIAIVGIGKIARDQHVPAIRGNGAFSLAATVSPHDAGLPGVPHHASLDALLAQGPAVDAVALCTPPQVRYDLAAQALCRGAHVFLEKPPGATLAEVEALVDGVLDANPGQLEQYRGGKTKLKGFFVGACLKASGGRANPALVNKILVAKLDQTSA